MHLKKILFSALLITAGISSSTTAQAQRPSTDYVVTTAGDTLRGRIQLTGNAATVVRLHQPGQPTTTYTANTLRSYGTEHTTLRETKPVGSPTGPPQLLLPLVRGFVSLYAGKDPVTRQQRYYLQPADSAYVVVVPPATALLTYARLLSDCPDLNIGSSGFMAQYRYTHGGLVALATAYNRCRQKPFAVLKAPSGIRFNLGVKAGIGFPTFYPVQPDYYARTVFGLGAQDKSSYQVGAILLITTRSHWGVQLEANYNRLAATYPLPTQSVYSQSNYIGLYGVKLRYAQLQVPVLVHYTVTYGTLTPYINFGPALSFNVSDRSTKQLVDSNGKYTGEVAYSTGDRAAILTGLVGAGLLVRREGWPALLVEGRYDYPLDRFGNNTTTKSVRLEAGILF